MVKKIKIEGLDCPNCARVLENKLNQLSSVNSVKIDFLKATIIVDSDKIEPAISDIINLTKEIEPDAKLIVNTDKKNFKIKFILDLILLIVGVAIGVCTLFIEMPTWLFWSLYIVSALMLGYKTYYKAVRLLFKCVINENFLVTLSILGATLVG